MIWVEGEILPATDDGFTVTKKGEVFISPQTPFFMVAI